MVSWNLPVKGHPFQQNAGTLRKSPDQQNCRTCSDWREESSGDIKDGEAWPVVDCGRKELSLGVPCQGSHRPCIA